MNTKEAADYLGVTINTLRIWERIFNIHVQRDKKNNRFYDEDIIKNFERIKKLKEANNETEDIIELLRSEGEIIPPIMPDITPTITDKSIPSITPTITPNFTSELRSLIKGEIQEYNELAEKYAKATYMIGQLEAEKKALDDKIKLLPSPDEIYKLESEKKALEEKIKILPGQDEFDKVKEENITIKQKLSLFPEPEVFNQIKQEKEHLVNENLILQRQVQKLLDEVNYHKLSWWDKLCLKLNKNQKMVVHKVNIEALT